MATHISLVELVVIAYITIRYIFPLIRHWFDDGTISIN